LQTDKDVCSILTGDLQLQREHEQCGQLNRAGTAKVGGPSTVNLARFSTVWLAFTQQINNRAEPY